MVEFGDHWMSSGISVFGRMDFGGASPTDWMGFNYGSAPSDFRAPQNSFTLPPQSYSPPPPAPAPAPAPAQLTHLPTQTSSSGVFIVGPMDYYAGASATLVSLTAAAAGDLASTAAWVERHVRSHVINVPNIAGSLVTLGQVAYAAYGKDTHDLRAIVELAGGTIVGAAATEGVGYTLAVRAAASTVAGMAALNPVATALLIGGSAFGGQLLGALGTSTLYQNVSMGHLESIADRVIEYVHKYAPQSN